MTIWIRIILIDSDLIVDGVNIGKWVKNKKRHFSNNLNKDKVDLLIESGILKGIQMYEKVS